MKTGTVKASDRPPRRTYHGISLRGVFFNPKKLRAVWRLLLFLAVAAVVARALSWAISTLGVGGSGTLWAISRTHSTLALSLLIASLVMMRGVEHKPVAALGFPWGSEALIGFLKGTAIGVCFIAALMTVQVLVGWLQPEPDAGTASGWLGEVARLALVLIIAAVAEELLLRGYPFQVLVEGMGAVLAVFLTSGLFALIHLNNPRVSGLGLVNIGLAGVLFAAAYLRTRSLWVPIGLHWGWNLAMGALFDLPVSGIFFDIPVYDVMQRGPDLVTGGAFGPEASLLITIFVLPTIVWVFRTRWLAESPRMAKLEPLVDARLGTTRNSKEEPG